MYAGSDASVGSPQDRSDRVVQITTSVISDTLTTEKGLLDARAQSQLHMLMCRRQTA